MKICFFDVKSGRKACINKDFMGGYGWAFNAGKSLPARLINFVKKAGEKLPIMSFGYLAAIFAENGWDVEYAENAIPDSNLVIIQSSMVEHRTEIEWARRLKNAGKTVGFIGPFSGAMPEIFLKVCDFVIRGEPEEAALRIAKGLNPKGVIESKAIQDLDSLSFPKWDIFPYNKYSYVPALKEKPFFPVLSSRGCPYACNYCPYLVTYAWRQRSSRNVLDEIGHLIGRYNLKGLLFRDPIFTANRNRTIEIAQGISQRQYRIRWACETRLDHLDKELLKLMYDAGLRVINVGVESASEDVIRGSSRKPIEIEHQEEMIRYCEELGIRVTVFYMFGMPDDTKDSLINTIRYAKKLNTHVAQFFIFTPFPGTEYYQKAIGAITEKNWERFDCYTPVMRHKNLCDLDILKLKEKAFVSYYYRPAWMIKFFARAIQDVFDK